MRGLRFDKALLPAAEPAIQQQSQTREQLEALANQLAERDHQLREAREESAASREELERLRQQITALRKANQAAAQPEADLTEFDNPPPLHRPLPGGSGLAARGRAHR